VIDATFELAGESWSAMPERSLLRPRSGTLYIADVHLGKAATFRAHSLPIPGGTTQRTLQRLSHALHRTSARRLIILGDLLHARAGNSDDLRDQLLAWRLEWKTLPIQLLRGNHDRNAGRIDDALQIDEIEPSCSDNGVTLWHYPPAFSTGPWLAGHLHPAVRLASRAQDGVVLPCFHVRGSGVVLPAFGEFTGTSIIEVQPGERVLAIADDAVLAV
jgi:DNA ligase-associated metallophosphoesterase